MVFEWGCGLNPRGQRSRNSPPRLEGRRFKKKMVEKKEEN